MFRIALLLFFEITFISYRFTEEILNGVIKSVVGEVEEYLSELTESLVNKI